jgi:hypothetical protein
MTNIAIEVRRPYKETTTFSFQDGTYVIGRDEGDIVMGDSQVSGRHAEITVQNGSVVFKDLGSTNGSYLEGGARIEGPYTIPVNGVIRMGGSTLVLIKLEAPDAYGKTMLQPAVAQPEPRPAAEITPSPAPLVKAQEEKTQDSASSDASGERASGFQGYFNDLVELLKYAFQTLKPRIVEAALPIALVGIPLPLIVAILSQLIRIATPFGVLLAAVIAILSFVASLPVIAAMVLFIYPVISRYALALCLGDPVTMGQVWRNHKRRLGANLLNTFVTTLLGGLTLGLLGVYIFQIPYVEGKTNVDVNMRSWNLFKNSWKRVLFVGIGTGILFGVPTVIATTILGIIPFLGPIVGVVVWGLMLAVYMPFVFLILSRIYFETRETLEGADPRPAARSAINEY